MAYSERDKHFKMSHNRGMKRTDFPDQNADFDTLWYNAGVAPEEIASMRDALHDDSPYNKNPKSSNLKYKPRFSNVKDPLSLKTADGRPMYGPSDGRRYQATPTIPPRVDALGNALNPPVVSIGARPPHVPAYKTPNDRTTWANPDIAFQYHAKQDAQEDLERRIGGIMLSIQDRKKASYNPSQFRPQEQQIEAMRREKNSLKKEEQKLRRRSNREVQAMGGHVDYGHRKAAEEDTPYERYLRTERKPKKDSKYKYH